ncbi:hypothetical protein C8Q76DRAFT_741865 [Earliella scabrosa]|nr:hypothetical protein C8Q76DRAFT_741865 [Earliella scabrosa]
MSYRTVRTAFDIESDRRWEILSLERRAPDRRPNTIHMTNYSHNIATNVFRLLWSETQPTGTTSADSESWRDRSPALEQRTISIISGCIVLSATCTWNCVTPALFIAQELEVCAMDVHASMDPQDQERQVFLNSSHECGGEREGKGPTRTSTATEEPALATRVVSEVAGDERLGVVRNQHKKLFYIHIILVSLAVIIGDAFCYGYFITVGHFVLRLTVPTLLDPERQFKTATLSSTNTAARFGVWIVGVPPLLTLLVSVAVTLDECATLQSVEPANSWLAQRIQWAPASLLSVARYAWDTMAGPVGVWINQSWPGPLDEPALDAWHAACAALLGRLTMKLVAKMVVPMLTRWRDYFKLIISTGSPSRGNKL